MKINKSVSQKLVTLLSVVAVLASFAVLLNLVIDTWLIQSELRYWVAVIVSIYLIAVITFLIRHEARRVLLVSNSLWISNLLVFVLVVALAPFHPAGLTNGIAFFGSSDELAYSILIVGVLLVTASYTLPWVKLPQPLRIAVTVMFLLGLSVFLIAIVSERGLDNLFLQGDQGSLWLRWGAILATFVCLPLLVILFGMRLLAESNTLTLLAKITLIAALALPILPPVVIYRATTNAPAMGVVDKHARTKTDRNNGDPSDEKSAEEIRSELSAEIEAVSQDLRDLYNMGDQIAADLPLASIDPAVVLRSTGTETDAVFRWVRDNTYFVSYAGTLRGASGVLMDRRGNSLDRSLFLSSLLSKVGVETRLARSHIRRSDAEKILKSANLALEDANVRRLSDLSLSEYADTLHNQDLADRFRKTIVNRKAENQSRLEQLVSRADSIAASIEGKISDQRSADRAMPDDVAQIQDHWWLQARTDGVWRDLDLSKEAAGELFAAPDEVFPVSDVPDDLKHEVEIRLILEVDRPRTGKEKHILVRHRVDTSEPSTSFSLRQIPLGEGLGNDESILQQSNESIQRSLRSEIEWLPIIVAGGGSQIVMDKYFNVSGDVFDSDDMDPNTTRLANSVSRNVTSTVGSATDLFGSLMTESSDEGVVDPVLKERAELSQWLEIEVFSPGSKPYKYIRPVTEVSENNLSTTGANFAFSIDFLIANSQLSDAYVAHELLNETNRRRKWYETLVYSNEGARHDEALANLASPSQFDFRLANLAHLRSVAAADASSWLAGPLVLSSFAFIRDDGDDPRLLAGIDIIHRSSGNWSDPTEVRSKNIRQGVIDTVVEAALIGNQPGLQNTATMFEMSNPDDWTLIQSVDDAGLVADEIGEAAVTNLRASLASGYLALVPPRLQSVNGRKVFGWWQIDPVSGATLGVDSELRGSAMAEWIIRSYSITRGQFFALRLLGCNIVAAASLSWSASDNRSFACSGYLNSSNERIVRAVVKAEACLLSSVAFYAPGTALYSAGAAIGAASFAETVGSVTVGWYMGMSPECRREHRGM